MDRKSIIVLIIGVVVTFVVTFFLTSGQEVVEAGIDAQAKELIREVLREEMTVDINGETLTYGQALTLIHTKVTAMEAAVGVLVAD